MGNTSSPFAKRLVNSNGSFNIVHLNKYSKEELNMLSGELLVMISYYDDSFNQEVHQLHSYILSDLKIDCKFIKAYYYNKEGKIVLDYKLFKSFESVKS